MWPRGEGCVLKWSKDTREIGRAREMDSVPPFHHHAFNKCYVPGTVPKGWKCRLD